MKNKIINLRALFLAFFSVFSVFNGYSWVVIEECNGFTCELELETHNLTIIGLIGNNVRSEEIVIPETVVFWESDTKVTAIAPYLFDGNTTVKSVKFPAQITSIPEGCFRNCENLERIEGSGVARYEDHCFKNCTSLRHICGQEIVKENTLFIPKTCISIGKNVFEGWDVEHLEVTYSEIGLPNIARNAALCLREGSFGGLHNLKTAYFLRTCFFEGEERCGVPFTDNPNLEEIRFYTEYITSADGISFYPRDGYPKKYDVTEFYSYLAQRNGTPLLKKVIVERGCKEPVAMDYGEAELIINSEQFLLGDRITDAPIRDDLYRDFADRWEHGALYGVLKLTIGENVKEICIDKFENLKELTVLIPYPPAYGNKFADKVYKTALLKVPEESLELYKSTPGWMRFNIQAIGSADVGDIVTETDTAETQYFDLTGRKVSAPEKGIYIVKDSRGVRKVIF